MTRTALQRLLWPGETQLFADGSSVLAGVVAGLREVVDFTDPRQIIDAHGFTDLGPYGPDPDFVDVLRFWWLPLMQLSEDTGSFGFARTDLGVVPVWQLTATRVPIGAEIWRFGTGGRSQRMSRYDGLGTGWNPGLTWRPPRQWVGPRVERAGLDLPASFSPDLAELIAVHEGPTAPEEFTTVRPNTHEVAISTARADSVFALDLTGSADGIALHLIERLGDHFVAHVATAEQAAALGGRTLSPGLHEVRLPVDAVHDTEGVQRIWTPQRLDPPDADATGERLDAFLARLADLPPSPGLSLRGCPPDAIFTAPGQTVTTQEVLSTSRRIDVATENGSSEALYAVIGRTGRDLSAISERPDDAAVLFMPGLTFTVRRTLELAGRVVHVVIERDAEESAVLDESELVASLEAALREHDRTRGRRVDAPEGAFAGDIR